MFIKFKVDVYEDSGIIYEYIQIAAFEKCSI